MKRLLVAGLLTAGILGFSTNDANAQWITSGYWGTSVYPGYYPTYYSTPGYSISFRYYDNDYRYRKYDRHRYRHSRYHRHYDRHDRWDRHDRHRGHRYHRY